MLVHRILSRALNASVQPFSSHLIHDVTTKKVNMFNYGDNWINPGR